MTGEAMDDNSSYERDETFSRAGKLLGNLGLAVSVVAFLPGFMFFTATVFTALFVVLYAVFLIIAVIFTFGTIFASGFPLTGAWDFIDKFLPKFLEVIRDIMPLFLPVAATAAAALAVGAIVVGAKSKGAENSKGVIGRGIAALIITVAAIVLSVMVLSIGGGAA